MLQNLDQTKVPKCRQLQVGNAQHKGHAILRRDSKRAIYAGTIALALMLRRYRWLC